MSALLFQVTKHLKIFSECIDSILALNAIKWLEIVVVDNSSSQPVIDYLDQMASNGTN